jgi:hypothetical protein
MRWSAAHAATRRLGGATVGEQHKADEFGKRNPTVFGANVNDPEMTALSAPYLIRQAGVDERQAAGRLAPQTPQAHFVETVPLWVWVAIFAIMFVVGVTGLLLLAAHGSLDPQFQLN